MQIEFTAAPGTSLLAKSLPNGHMIKGIQIDNPSGNWLYVVSEQVFCPPYTIGWAIPTTYDQSSVNVEARLIGPANQTGSNQGENWRLNLFDVEVSPSAGVPYQFILGYTPVLRATSTFQATTTGQGGAVFTTLIAAIANKRIRLLTAAITTRLSDNPVEVILSENNAGGAQVDTLMAGGATGYVDRAIYPLGNDLSLGAALGYWWMSAAIVDIPVNLVVSYQVL